MSENTKTSPEESGVRLVRDSLASVSGEEYRRICKENAALRSKSFWKAESDLLKRSAELMENEAQTWAEGFATVQKDGTLYWEKNEHWAHVRHYRLIRTAQRLREMAARIFNIPNTRYPNTIRITDDTNS